MNKVKLGLLLIGMGVGVATGAVGMHIFYTKAIVVLNDEIEVERKEREAKLVAYYEEREEQLHADHAVWSEQMRKQLALERATNEEKKALVKPVSTPREPRVRKATKQKEEVLNNVSN